MSTFKRFEEMPVWQNARKFASNAYEIVHVSQVNHYFKLRDQMIGSSGSVMDNIAEGFERSGNREFIQFLYYSKGSAGEFRSQLYRALDAKMIKEEKVMPLIADSEKISAELHNFIQYLERSQMKGFKYQNR